MKELGHSATVEWSEEDQCYVGRCPDLFAGGVHADTRAECENLLFLVISNCLENPE